MSIKPKLPVEDFYLQFHNFHHHLGNEDIVKPKLHRTNPSMAKKHKGLNLKALRNRPRHVKVVRKAGGGGVSGSGKLDLNITMNNCGSAGGQGGAGVTSLGGMAGGMMGQLNPTNNLAPNPYGSANPFMGQTNRQQYLQPQPNVPQYSGEVPQMTAQQYAQQQADLQAVKANPSLLIQSYMQSQVTGRPAPISTLGMGGLGGMGPINAPSQPTQPQNYAPMGGDFSSNWLNQQQQMNNSMQNLPASTPNSLFGI
jgi:hypothetical protein